MFAHRFVIHGCIVYKIATRPLAAEAKPESMAVANSHHTAAAAVLRVFSAWRRESLFSLRLSGNLCMLGLALCFVKNTIHFLGVLQA